MIVTAKFADRDFFISGNGSAAAALIEKFSGESVLRSPGAELLKGDFRKGASTVISEWPDKKDTARRYWNSPEYRKTKNLREGIADWLALLIDGTKINGTNDG